jgi:hypothetical protein
VALQGSGRHAVCNAYGLVGLGTGTENPHASLPHNVALVLDCEAVFRRAGPWWSMGLSVNFLPPPLPSPSRSLRHFPRGFVLSHHIAEPLSFVFRWRRQSVHHLVAPLGPNLILPWRLQPVVKSSVPRHRWPASLPHAPPSHRCGRSRHRSPLPWVPVGRSGRATSQLTQPSCSHMNVWSRVRELGDQPIRTRGRPTNGIALFARWSVLNG